MREPWEQVFSVYANRLKYDIVEDKKKQKTQEGPTVKNDKYINTFREVMDELGISFTMEGPFPKKLPKHQLPGNGL